MFELLLLAYLTYRNAIRAKLKDQNPVTWGLVTVVAYFAAMMIGAMVVVVFFCRDIINLNSFATLDLKTREVVSQRLQQAVASNPLHMLTIEMFSSGGYLLVRYFLDKKPNKKGPEVHWMDKLGHQEEEK